MPPAYAMNTKLECLALGRAKGFELQIPSCVEIDFIVKARDHMTDYLTTI